ncbi:alginate biosynthesis transcriptional regulatory protein AlgB [bacterium BMS3Abin03]|nr:alginate biosynthesis transcriptional regulatory protein AlgB [bacterium BMS3Abin03]
MALFIVAVIVFIIADLIIRLIAKKIREKKIRQEREEALKVSLKLDYSREAKTLKRAEVENPKAKILCVDDEPVILDSFRKILVLDGYSVDTVETGKEALALIQNHSYDFVFTDLKMPGMDGVEVTKAVKHLRPDIDVIIITGYATVETAVECMKYGAMDYVQKPFTEDELLEFTKKSLIKRQDRIQKMLKPKVQITHLEESSLASMPEFLIPGGVFIYEGHTWANIDEEGTVKIGIDDFAKKLIGKIDAIEFPNLGMIVKKGQPLFTIKQGARTITFRSPVSGKVKEINKPLSNDLEALEYTPYERNWICIIDADELDNEIPQLKIGKAAVAFYQEDIEHLQQLKKKIKTGKEEEYKSDGHIYIGEMEKLDDISWKRFSEEFFEK